MRNLKKILALVLAFVMSLSLMATASAADFTDASSINEKYETAIEVLEGLGVFKGYQDGTFQPTGSITRAETAAIIYRIVTGDVKDEQVKIYSDYNLFSDVPSTSWFAGYVNYCANAEYIKGVGGGKFEPNSRVTGYAALAMILRAIGYTANGGFTGPDWEVQTARTGEARKITKNILTGTLGENATRETVAEILFQAILVNMVDHNILNTENGNQGYFELDESLGYKTFGLEELEGVVVANEYADLYSAQVLDDGKTNFEVAKDDIRSLNYGTAITDIGERQLAYITGSTVLSMTNEGLNKVTENDGAAVDIRTAASFRSTADMNQVFSGADATQFYVDFGRTGNVTCDQRLEFQVTFQNPAAETSFDNYAGVNIAAVAAEDNLDANTDNNWTVTDNTGVLTTAAIANGRYVTGYPVTYHKIIRAGIDISESDLSVIFGIFGAADNFIGLPGNANRDLIDGDVFVGTYSTQVNTEDRDISNKISYNKFVADYLNPETYDINWNVAGNGTWVKFIDNDLDGNCDYAFATNSWLDEATGTFTNRAGDTVTEFNRFNDDPTRVPNGGYKVRYMNGETPAVGDKVVCAWIDNQILVEPANDVTKTVNVYNWRDDTITTTDGDTYGQSQIGNWTGMQELLDTMDEKTEYIMYFDHFGYVRAYELPGGTQYALVTEIYASNNATGNVLQNWPMTVELKAGEAASAEYNLVGGGSSAFVALTPWTEVSSLVGRTNYYNWLQPAIAHLGVTRLNNATGFTLGPVRVAPSLNGSYTFWPNWNQVVRGDIIPGTTTASVTTAPVGTVSQEFNYGTQAIGTNNANQANTVSFTNVAAVNINDGSATLKGAAELRLDNQGNVVYWDTNGNGIFGDAGDQARYDVDYVQLTRNDVVADQTMYPVDPAYGGWQNQFVNATHDTEFYIVHNGGVEYFKDYVNMPALTNANNYIHAAYAVARDTSADSATAPYWVADVIVYEVRSYNDDSRTSVSLVYFDQTRTTGQTRLLKALNSTTSGSLVDLVPAPLAWNAGAGTFNEFSGYWFYQVYNGEASEDGSTLTARRIARIPETVNGVTRTYASYGIYAGTVDRVTLNASNGGYITVNMPTAGGGTQSISLAVSDNVFSITTDQELGSTNTYNEANKLRYNNVNSNEVRPGDRIVWQGGALAGNALTSSNYIVDLGNPALNAINRPLWVATPSFLTTPVTGLWSTIMTEEGAAAAAPTDLTITIKSVVPNAYGAVADKKIATLNKDNATGTITYNLTDYTPDGLVITGVTTDPDDTDDFGGTASSTGVDITQTLSGGAGSAWSAAGLIIDVTNVMTGAKNVTVTITYDYDSYNLTGGTYTNSINPAVAITNVSANGTTLAPAGTKAYHYKDTVDLVVTLDKEIDTTKQEVIVEYDATTPANDKTVTATRVSGTSFYFDGFKMPAEGVTVNVSVVGKQNTITASGAGTYTWTNATAGTPTSTATTRWPGDVTLVVTDPTGHTVNAPVVKADGVTLMDGTEYTWTSGTKTVVLVDDYCMGKNITIEFTSTPDTYNITVSNTNNIGAYYSLESAEAATHGTTLSDALAGQTMTYGDTLWIYVTDNTVPAVTETGGATVYTSTADRVGQTNVLVYKYTGIHTDVTITLP